MHGRRVPRMRIPRALEELARAFVALEALTELDLSGVVLRGAAAQEVAVSLEKCERLKTLNLANCRLGNTDQAGRRSRCILSSVSRSLHLIAFVFLFVVAELRKRFDHPPPLSTHRDHERYAPPKRIPLPRGPKIRLDPKSSNMRVGESVYRRCVRRPSKVANPSGANPSAVNVLLD